MNDHEKYFLYLKYLDIATNEYKIKVIQNNKTASVEKSSAYAIDDLENLILTEQSELPDNLKWRHFVIDNVKPSKLKSHSIYNSSSEKFDFRVQTKSTSVENFIWQDVD